MHTWAVMACTSEDRLHVKVAHFHNPVNFFMDLFIFSIEMFLETASNGMVIYSQVMAKTIIPPGFTTTG